MEEVLSEKPVGDPLPVRQETAPRPASLRFGRELNRRLKALRLNLLDCAAEHDLPVLLTRVLDEVGRLVDSPLGFFHFIEADQRTIALQQWSTSTLASFCRAEGRGLHYDLEQAGVWADCVREGRPVVHNDYLALPHRRGLPAGHAELVRELVVPVLAEGRVAAILGVGNKPAPYTPRDVDIVQHVADLAWGIVRRKRAEEMLGLQKDIEAACAELSASLLITRDLSEISRMIVDTAGRLTRSRIGFVGSIDPRTRHLLVHAMYAWEPGELPSVKLPVFPGNKGLWGWVLGNGRPLLTNHALTDERAGGVPVGHIPVHAFLGVPVTISGEVCGILALANPDNAFLDVDLALAQRLADLYALALQRHRLEAAMVENEMRKAEELEYLVGRRTAELHAANASLLAEIEERKRIEAALSAEKETARLYLDIARVGFVALDAEERITLVNDYLRRVLGYSEEELLGRSWNEFLLPVEKESAYAGARRRSQPGTQYGCHENWIRTGSGDIRRFVWNDVTLENAAGECIGMLCSGEDITEVIQAEEQLRRGRFYQDILTALLHNTPLAMVFFVVEGESSRILDWNPSAERIFGWSKKEVWGRELFRFLPVSEDMAEVLDVYEQLRQNPGPHNLVNRCHSKSGERRMIHWFNNSFRDDRTGHIYVVSLGHDITLQHAWEERLRQSEEHLRTIANFTYDWEDWRGTDGNYLYVSPSCERITGYRPGDFLADSNLTLAIIHPEDRDRLAHHVHHEQAVGEAHLIDFRIITKSGETRWIGHCCQPVYGERGEWLGRRSSNRDITERKKTERQLRESRNLLQMVVDGIHEPLLLVKRDGTILMMNAPASTYFQIPAGEVCGRQCGGFICLSGCRLDCRVLETIRSGKNTSFERKGIFDPQRVERVYIDTLGATGEHDAMAIVRILDITLEKQIERDLMQADKMISLGTLVSGVAHEINNPNNFISLNANLLKDAWDSLMPVLERYRSEHGDFLAAGLPYSEMREEIPNLLSGIEAGARRIQRIVTELREYSMPTLDGITETLSLNDVVWQAVILVASKVKQFTDNFSVEYGEDLPPVKGSGQKLEQVVINLVINACQSLPDRQKAVRLSTAWNREDDTVCVIIKDEGNGIPESLMPQIMNPFFTTRRDIGGTGLGLSVSSRIVAEHQGRIEVRSEPGRGSTFTVHLPPAGRAEAGGV